MKGGSLAVLRGNLAPNGAVIKPAAAEARLLKHKGPAVVFADYNDMAARIDDPNLPVTRDSVIVLKHAGPQGAPGMPEWGQLPIPKKLLEQGVRDMLRISDARMSGTSYGACVLHVAPESFVGGPLEFVRDGDLIELDVDARKLHLHVSDDELARRKAAWTPPAEVHARLRRAVPAPHHAGRPGLRLRFPRRRGADRRARVHDADVPRRGRGHGLDVSTTRSRMPRRARPRRAAVDRRAWARDLRGSAAVVYLVCPTCRTKDAALRRTADGSCRCSGSRRSIQRQHRRSGWPPGHVRA